MRYAEQPVSEGLSDAVRCIWTLHGDPPVVPGPVEPVLPDGCAELIINLGDPFEECRNGAWETQPARFLYGQLTRAINLRPTGRTAIIGVRFQPWGVYQLFGPEAVRADERLPLAMIDTGWDEHLISAIAGERPDAALSHIVKGLLERPKRPVETVLLRFIRALQAPDAGPLDRLKADAALSERQLERRFIALVGLRPKLFERIIRLRRLVDLLHAGDTKGFAELAHAAGYFDQAHFNRDLKAFTGMAPRAYFKQDLVLPEYFSGVR